MEGGVSGAPHQAPHGTKRRADDDPKEDQRLAKRFNLLNIEQNGKLYIPVSQQPRSTSHDDSMHLDDTKDRIYIHNLDDEIASIEGEEGMVFLPDIEKTIGKIPQHVLTDGLQPTAANQMVLYGVPPSLTVPEEQDNVRKAILESRAWARERQSEEASVRPGKAQRDDLHSCHGDGSAVSHNGPGPVVELDDEDAMDIG